MCTVIVNLIGIADILKNLYNSELTSAWGVIQIPKDSIHKHPQSERINCTWSLWMYVCKWLRLRFHVTPPRRQQGATKAYKKIKTWWEMQITFFFFFYIALLSHACVTSGLQYCCQGWWGSFLYILGKIMCTRNSFFNQTVPSFKVSTLENVMS